MAVIKRHPLVFFFVLAYLLSWPAWLTQAAQARGLMSWHIPGTFAFIGLATAAYITAALTGGRAAVLDLLKRLVRWRANPLWYLVALLLTAGMALLAVLLFTLFGGSPQFGLDLGLSSALLYVLTNFPNMWLTEETAWRGFALPRMQKGQSALAASLVLGLLWGLWHIPLFLNPESFQARMPFIGFMISALANSVLSTWLFNHTRGSVLVLGLYHAVVDATIAYTGVMSSSAGLFWLFVAVMALTAALVTWVEGPATLARRADLTGVTYPPAPPPAARPNKARGAEVFGHSAR